jgi:hypothetical protein
MMADVAPLRLMQATKSINIALYAGPVFSNGQSFATHRTTRKESGGNYSSASEFTLVSLQGFQRVRLTILQGYRRDSVEGTVLNLNF